MISIAQLMVVLDATIANIAIPYIAEDLDFSRSNQAWIITGYTLAFGGLLLLGGRLGDLFGRRKVFMIGVLDLRRRVAARRIAQNQELLLASRALQGLGAAIASPTALALITTTFPAGKERNRAFAVYAAMSGAGAAVGLILGGWLTEYSWRWTFLINVPIGIAAAVLAPMVLAESKPRGSRSTCRAPSPARSACWRGLRPHPGRDLVAQNEDKTWTDTWTDRRARRRRPAARRVHRDRDGRVKEPLMPFRILADRTRGVSFVGDDAGAGGHVRDVLLPERRRPGRHGLQLAEDRLRVPAVQRWASSSRPASRPT